MQPLPSATDLIRSSWDFYRKQPALNAVLLWLLILPGVLQTLLQYVTWDRGVLAENGLGRPAYLLASLALSILSLWGVACLLLVGRRLIRSKAGRSRTSFRAVRRQSRPLLVPFFFTSLLRSFIAIYWTLLFFVPALLIMVSSPTCNAIIPGSIKLLTSGAPSAIQSALSALVRNCSLVFWLLPLLFPAMVYLVQTTFYPMALVDEKKTYRDALRRSREVMRGHFWATVWLLLRLNLLLFVPLSLLSAVIDAAIQGIEPRLAPLSLLLGYTLSSLGGMLVLLCSVQIYGALRNAHDGRPVEVQPDDDDDE